MICPEVCCRSGKVKGFVSVLKCEDAKPVFTFRNIPFAKPPLGSLRFMPPQRPEPWEGTRDCTVTGNIPMQSKILGDIFEHYLPLRKEKVMMSEDCLHLSVYTSNANASAKLPVMVWFYSGRFEVGSESLYDGTALAGMNDVVVVIPNYRLGILGFLSLGRSSVCPGNVGMLDQLMALRWVQENIEAFGGDPNNVTIFGESAGGFSVNHHVNSPLSRDLFHKAISHSGQSTIPVFFQTEPNTAKEALLNHFGIEEKEDVKILNKLQAIPTTDFVTALEALHKENITFFPTVDDHFLMKAPKDSLRDKDFTKVPYIMGCNNTESQGVLTAPFVPGFEDGLSEESMKRTFPFPSNDDVFQACKELYISDDQDEKRFSKMFGDMMADIFSVSPLVETAKAHAESGSDVYVCLGAFQLRLSHDDTFGPGVGKKPDWCICDHMDDMLMTFGFPFLPEDGRVKYTKEERDLSRNFMSYITNFARHGDPNKGLELDVLWPKYEPGGEHLVLKPKFEIGRNLRVKEVEFWRDRYPKLLEEADA